MVSAVQIGDRKAIAVSQAPAGGGIVSGMETSPDHLRLFIALAIPAEVKGELGKAQAELRRHAATPSVRWVRSGQFHLTLRFLGNVAAGRVAMLEKAMAAACAGFGPLPLEAKGIGCFPNELRPRVVWVGVEEPRGDLKSLWRAIESAAREFTREPAEDAFVGHLTLARIKRIDHSALTALLRTAREMAQRPFGTWTAAQVEIVRSEPGPDGSRYSTLAAIPLRPGAPGVSNRQ